MLEEYTYDDIVKIAGNKKDIRYYGKPEFAKGRLFLVDHISDDIMHEFIPTKISSIMETENIDWRDVTYNLVYSIFID